MRTKGLVGRERMRHVDAKQESALEKRTRRLLDGPDRIRRQRRGGQGQLPLERLRRQLLRVSASRPEYDQRSRQRPQTGAAG